MVRATRAGLSAAAVLVLVLPAGCQQPQKNPYKGILGPEPPPEGTAPKIDPTKVESRDDIVEVFSYPPPLPWLYDVDKPIGFKSRVYLRSSETGKGAFGRGTIVAIMSLLEPGKDGHMERHPVHIWELDEQQALGWRVRTVSPMGYSYGFMLLWPDDLPVYGKQVEIVFTYRRADGRTVSGAPRRLPVPAPGTFAPPPTTQRS